MASRSSELRAWSMALCKTAAEQCADARLNVMTARHLLQCLAEGRVLRKGRAHPLAAVLEAGRQQSDLSVDDLWAGYVALGGNAGKDRLAQYLDGRRVPGRTDFNVIAQAINDRFTELGEGQPFPYAEDL